MIGLLKEPLFFLTATLLLYSAASWLYRRLGLLFLQPVLLTVVLMILFLALTGIEYESYMEGGKIIHFFLGPSVVALGVPLYLRSTELRKEFGAIAVSLLFGSLTGIISVVLPLLYLGVPREIILSMAPKSVTTPVAMGIAEKAGGIPSLTAAAVVVTGILGALIGPVVLKLCGVVSGTPFGFAMGTASHGIGTARALETGELEGASSGLAICLNGILTSVFTPLVIRLFL
jgi:predicted murein hydrolase (TIGR00659 family)